MDEGKTWPHTRHLEHSPKEEGSPSGAYPSIIQGEDGSLHVVYSYSRNEPGQTQKTIKHARFTELWIRGERP
jgi:predicted neuraminidase